LIFEQKHHYLVNKSPLQKTIFRFYGFFKRLIKDLIGEASRFALVFQPRRLVYESSKEPFAKPNFQISLLFQKAH